MTVNSFRPKQNVLPSGTPTRTGTKEVSREYFSSYERAYPRVICLSLGASEGPEYSQGRPTGVTLAKEARWVHDLNWQNFISANKAVVKLASKSKISIEVITQTIYDIVGECMNDALQANDSTPWPGFKFNPTRTFSKNERDQTAKAQLMMDIAPLVDKHVSAVRALMAERDATDETRALAASVREKHQAEAEDKVPF